MFLLLPSKGKVFIFVQLLLNLHSASKLLQAFTFNNNQIKHKINKYSVKQ